MPTWLNWLLGFLLFLMIAASAFSAEPDLRVGVGVDVVHRAGAESFTAKYGAANVIFWEHNRGVGATYDVGAKYGWQAGVGGIYVSRTDQDVGTHANFQFRGGYCDRRACLMATHISHGAVLGIARDKANSGLNFVGVEVRL